ncbi:MAG: hypothetical protein CMB99_10655 [Flavobacteriaceae bacterium]|nr:hypothetical protein [Flavobacteriaceae bacterium]|tara:strand:- start:201909 stop:202139 length:231 start_codon:yes stop_codon:yes gene_type:complete
MIEKIAQRPYVVMAVLVFILMFVLDTVFGMTEPLLRGAIAGGIGFILSPRVKAFQTQTGPKKQITWFLLKEPIIKE